MNDDISKRLANLPRHAAPPELKRFIRTAFLDEPAPKNRFWPTFVDSLSWRPAGAFAAAAALLAGVFIYSSTGNDGAMDLQPLLAAHSRYQAESLVPTIDTAHSNLSAQLASYYVQNR